MATIPVIGENKKKIQAKYPKNYTDLISRAELFEKVEEVKEGIPTEELVIRGVLKSSDKGLDIIVLKNTTTYTLTGTRTSLGNFRISSTTMPLYDEERVDRTLTLGQVAGYDAVLDEVAPGYALITFVPSSANISISVFKNDGSPVDTKLVNTPFELRFYI